MCLGQKPWLRCSPNQNDESSVRCTKPHFFAQNHTLWMSYRQKALAFTPGQQGSHGEKLFRPLFMTHAIPGTRPTRLCRLPCPNLRLMLSTRCPWPHWFCLLQIKSKPPARNSAWSAQTSSVEQCHAESATRREVTQRRGTRGPTPSWQLRPESALTWQKFGVV